MTIAISIAGAITVAVTVRLMYLLFLGGRRINEATAVGRFMDVLRPTAADFAKGWSEQGWRYRLTAYPCLVLTLAGVSALMYWLMPMMQTSLGVWDVVKYCLLIFFVGTAACLAVALILIFGIYFLREVIGQWWTGRKEKRRPPRPRC
ncbi:MAG: hypothetical protein LBJ46_01830 [Planctomycetota bacterium]|jgi:hypothetical protein|nr:hypothetical protein [Planctomycetota bacterium]